MNDRFIKGGWGLKERPKAGPTIVSPHRFRRVNPVVASLGLRANGKMANDSGCTKVPVVSLISLGVESPRFYRKSRESQDLQCDFRWGGAKVTKVTIVAEVTIGSQGWRMAISSTYLTYLDSFGQPPVSAPLRRGKRASHPCAGGREQLQWTEC